MDAKLELVTPLMAIQWLQDANKSNRRRRDWWSAALAAAIRRGEWVTTHQGIAFTKSGRLLDGQHRLAAVCLSNTPVEMFVFTGVPEDAFKVIDVGLKRRIEDVTGLDKKTAEVSRFIATLTYGGAATSQTVIDVAESGVAEVHQDLLAKCSKTRAVYTAAPVRAAAVALILDGHPAGHVLSVYEDLVHQRFDQLPPVAHALIRQVNDKKVSASRQLDLLARALKALSPRSKSLTKIQLTDEDGPAASDYVRKVVKRAGGAA